MLKARILYIIQLPPPVHGVSVLNKLVYSSDVINQGFEKKLIELKFSKEIRELRRFTIKKILVLIKTWFHLFLTLLHFRPHLVYFSLMPVGKGFLRDICFALLLKCFRTKIIYHLNNRGIPFYKEKIFYHWLYKKVFNNSTIIHVSEGLLKSEITPLRLKKLKAFAVGNTIPPFGTPPNKVKRDTINILFLSNYLPEKGLMILLEAMDHLIRRYPKIILNTYGAIRNEEEFNKYKRFVTDNHLAENIFIHGPVYGKDKTKVLAESDIFVFPSYFREECFPLTILEAMSAKLSIIATKIGAIPEIIEDGKEGILIDPKDPQQLAEKLEKLIQNSETRDKMGMKGYSKFINEYASPIFEKKMRAIFEAVIS